MYSCSPILARRPYASLLQKTGFVRRALFSFTRAFRKSFFTGSGGLYMRFLCAPTFCLVELLCFPDYRLQGANRRFRPISTRASAGGLNEMKQW
jgi:hypothetical protein